MSIDGLSSGLAGLQAAESRVNAVAAKMAQIASPDGNGGGDIIDLSALAVNLMQAKTQHAASVKAIQAVDDVQRAALDLLG